MVTFFDKVTLLGVKEFDGLHDDPKTGSTLNLLIERVESAGFRSKCKNPKNEKKLNLHFVRFSDVCMNSNMVYIYLTIIWIEYW